MDFFPSPHPLTPPQSEEDALDWIRLLRSRRVGVQTFFRMIEEHGSARDALEALPDVASAAGVDDYQACPMGVAEQEMRSAQKNGAYMVAYGSSDYPAALGEIPDPPPFFWAIGDISLLQGSMVALVGARNASSLGLRMARKLAEELGAKGHIVVSGLARGIDTAAHRGAVATGTIGVLAGGVDVIYPRENTELGREIGENGLLISEAPMGTSPQARHFPARNRIVSGLSRATVVVEAAARSGSLITARTALDQGRDVLAVPGHPFDARASGCNMLIRDGATLVRGAADVIEVLGSVPLPGDRAAAGPEPTARARATLREISEQPIPRPPEVRSKAEIRALHQMILDRLGPSPMPEDELIRDLSLPASAITPELTSLELDGRILREPGGMISRTDRH